MPEINSQKIKVGILRGGEGDHYEKSLIEGQKMIAYISGMLPDKLQIVDLLVDKQGLWHIQGLPVIPFDLIHKVDVVWDTTHPGLSQVLVHSHIPYFKIPDFTRAITNSKELLREHMKKIGVKVPQTIVLSAYQEDFDGPYESYAIKKAKEVYHKFAPPYMVQSFTGSTLMGIHVAKTFPQLISAIRDGVAHNTSVLVEELIPGKSAVVHSVRGFRNEDLYSLPTTELKNGNHITPGLFSSLEKEKLANLSRDIHSHLGATHYTKLNFVVSPVFGICLRSAELHPDFYGDASLHSSCESIGIKPESVLEHILNSLETSR